MPSKKLQRASVNYLKDYLTKKRTRILSTKIQAEVGQLIKEKEVDNSIFAALFVDSKIFRLAVVLMQKRKQTTKHRVLGRFVYDIDFSKIFYTMQEIVREGSKKGFFK